MKEIGFTIKDRIGIVSELLPDHGNFLIASLAYSIKEKMILSPKEIAEKEVISDNGEIRWNVEKDSPCFIIIEDAELQLLQAQVDELDRTGALKIEMIPTIMKLKEY